MTSDLVSPRKRDIESGRQLSPEQAAAAAMVAEAKARGLALTGPDGLLKLFTKNVLESALAEEMTEHLGHEKNRVEPGRESANVRNGTRSKTVVSDAVGEVDINVPRDRESTFEPQIVKKRQRRLTDVDEIVLSLYAKGLTTGEISAHFGEIYGASVSKETISRITDKVVAEMNDWASRPLDAVYAAVFIDAIHVKVRDGQVANRPVYAAIGVTVDGDGVLGDAGAVDLGQMRGDLPGRQALRRQRQHDPVDATQAALPLAHDRRLKAAVAIPRDFKLDRAGLGEHRLGPRAIAGVPAVAAGRIMLAVAQVRIQLPLKRRLQHQLGQLLQQTTLTADRHSVGLCPSHQLGHHLSIHHRRHRHGLRLTLVTHRCTTLHFGQLHRCSYRPARSTTETQLYVVRLNGGENRCRAGQWLPRRARRPGRPG